MVEELPWPPVRNKLPVYDGRFASVSTPVEVHNYGRSRHHNYEFDLPVEVPSCVFA